MQESFGNPLGPPEQALPNVMPGVPGKTEVNDCQSLRLRDPPRAGRHEVEAVRVDDRWPIGSPGDMGRLEAPEGQGDLAANSNRDRQIPPTRGRWTRRRRCVGGRALARRVKKPHGSTVWRQTDLGESRHRDSNAGPTLYESVALPTELWRPEMRPSASERTEAAREPRCYRPPRPSASCRENALRSWIRPNRTRPDDPSP